jgi:hypothetical protein
MVYPPRKAFPLLFVVSALAAGCASNKPAMVGDAGYRSPCPSDLTPACFEYLGKKLSCHCASRDGLREILEPMQQ